MLKNLKLKNKEILLNIIKDYSHDNNLNCINLMDEMCNVIEEQIPNSIHLDNILDIWIKESNQSIYLAEEEIYNVISLELEKLIREDILKQINNDDFIDIMGFLNNEYFKIFSNYYKKRKIINEKDFNECSFSLSKSYNIDIEVAEIFVSIFIEEYILNIQI